MAVKFPLEMKDGVQVRNISELKENFDVEKVVGYFLDGKLKKWLDARWYEEESEVVSKLDESDPLLVQHLCEIFGVGYEAAPINPEEIVARNERITKLKQYTDNEEIIKSIDNVAFDQEDLADLYDKDIEKIYLCEGVYSIPRSKQHLDYVEIGDVKYLNGFKSETLNYKKNEEIRVACYNLLRDLLENQERIKKEPEEFKLYTEGVLISGNITSRHEAERKTRTYLATAYNKREMAVKGVAGRLVRQCQRYSCYVEKEGNFYFDKLNQANNVIMQCNELLKEIEGVTFKEISLIELKPKDISVGTADAMIAELCEGVVKYDGCYSLDRYVEYADIESRCEGSGFFGSKFTYRIENIQNAVEEMKRDLRNQFSSLQCDKYIENANVFIKNLCDEINKRKEYIDEIFLMVDEINR